MRALMSYYELKRQRINKIKSKTYHKKLKREKEKKAMVCACVAPATLPGEECNQKIIVIFNVHSWSFFSRVETQEK